MSKITPSALGTAVVTGASSGIGKVYAERLARQGYDLHLVARREDRLKQLAETLTSTYGIAVQTTTADLAKPEHVHGLAQTLAADTSLTMLVNNAGVALMASIADSDPMEASAMIALNITALTQLTIAVLSGFKARNRGTIINIGSAVAFGVYPGTGIYSSTKAYILQFTRTLQAELAGTKVVAQLVAPAATISEGFDRAIASMPEMDPAMVMTTEDCVDASLQGLANGEAITIPPAEDAGLIAALTSASNALFAACMTGKPASRYGLTN